jgi:hypothetical protein
MPEPVVRAFGVLKRAAAKVGCRAERAAWGIDSSRGMDGRGGLQQTHCQQQQPSNRSRLLASACSRPIVLRAQPVTTFKEVHSLQTTCSVSHLTLNTPPQYAHNPPLHFSPAVLRLVLPACPIHGPPLYTQTHTMPLHPPHVHTGQHVPGCPRQQDWGRHRHCCH